MDHFRIPHTMDRYVALTDGITSGAFAKDAVLRQQGYMGDNINQKSHGVTFDISRVTPTASEIRPVNTAVRYLIRALP
jgi:hypothetical protein